MTARFSRGQPAFAQWLVLLVVAWAIPAQASFDAFIRFLPGKSHAPAYEGESTDEQFPATDGWSEIYVFSEGIARTTALGGGGQTASRAQFQPLSFSKPMDRGSIALFKACATGHHYDTVELALRKSGDDRTLKPFYRATLKNAFIVSQQWSGSGGDAAPIESISVQFEAIEWTYNLYDERGQLASITVHWNILANEGGFGPLPGELPEIHCPSVDVLASTAPGVCAAPVLFEVLASNSSGAVPVTCLPPSGSTFNKGITPVNCTATDADGLSVSCDFKVVVNDTEPPTITGESVDTPSLWPPDHKMRDVTVNYIAADNCGPVTTSLTVTSNEPETGLTSEDVGPDSRVIDAHHVQLRAERGNTKAGRTYTITITAIDAVGLQAVKTVKVSVPRSQAAVR